MSAVALGGGTVKVPLGGRRTPVRRLHPQWSPRRTESTPKPLAVSAVDSTAGRPIPRDGAFPLALILSPTRELSSQIHDVAKKFLFQTGVMVVVAHEGAPVNFQLRELEKGVDILVATPGSLDDLIERARVSLRNIKYLAIDEADRMLGIGFERRSQKIVVQQIDMPPPGARQTILFSATFPQEIQIRDVVKRFLFQTGVKSVVAYGGAPTNFQPHELKKGADILVAVRGLLLDLIERVRVSLRNVRYLAMDESVGMLDMGCERQVCKIVQQMDMPPLCCLSLRCLGYRGKTSLSIGVRRGALRLPPPRAMVGGGGTGLRSLILSVACVLSFTLSYSAGHIKYGIPVVSALLVGILAWVIQELGFSGLKLEAMEASVESGGPKFTLKAIPESPLGGKVEVDILLLSLAAFVGLAMFFMMTTISGTKAEVKRLKKVNDELQNELSIMKARIEMLERDSESRAAEANIMLGGLIQMPMVVSSVIRELRGT